MWLLKVAGHLKQTPVMFQSYKLSVYTALMQAHDMLNCKCLFNVSPFTLLQVKGQ